MRILVDADSCPVRKQIERAAMKYRVCVVFYANSCGKIRTTYARLIRVKSKLQAVDKAIIGRCGSGDIVITYDSGLAFRCVAKGAHVLHCNGWQFTNDQCRERQTKCSSKRKASDNVIFEKALEALLGKITGWLRS